MRGIDVLIYERSTAAARRLRYIARCFETAPFLSFPPAPLHFCFLVPRAVSSLSLGLSFCSLPRFLIGQRNFLPSARRRNSSIAPTPTGGLLNFSFLVSRARLASGSAVLSRLALIRIRKRNLPSVRYLLHLENNHSRGKNVPLLKKCRCLSTFSN